MPSQKIVRNFNNFGSGITTEANPVAFPENSAKTLTNVILNRDGTVFRRPGIDLENNARRSGRTQGTAAQTNAVSVHKWEAVNGNGELDFIVVQWGGYLRVHDTAGGEFNSSSSVKAEWSYEPLKIDTTDSWLTELIDGTSGSGRFFGCSKAISPFYIEYDESGDSFTVNKLSLRIRDVDGLDETNDTSSANTDVPVESDAHLIKDTKATITDGSTTVSWTMSSASSGSAY